MTLDQHRDRAERHARLLASTMESAEAQGYARGVRDAFGTRYRGPGIVEAVGVLVVALLLLATGYALGVADARAEGAPEAVTDGKGGGR